MKQEITVVACANAMPSQPYLARGFNAFKKSCESFGFEPLILGWGEPWGGLGSKPKLLKKAIEARLIKTPYILFVDAFDVVFSRSPELILEQWLDTKLPATEVTWNAELFCFPNHSYGQFFPETNSPFRYLNSGASIGTTDAYLRATKQMNVDTWLNDYRTESGQMYERNDQNDWMEKFLFGQCGEDEPKMELDYQCEIFQTIFGTEESWFAVNEMYNLKTKEYPAVWHFNGPGKSHPLFDKILTKLGY
jgi:hypothetical protein